MVLLTLEALGTETLLAIVQPTLLQGTKVGLKDHEEVFQDNSRLFPIDLSGNRTSNRHTSQVEEIRRTHCDL